MEKDDYFLCPDCKSFTRPRSWDVHYCVPYSEPGRPVNQMDVLRKKWNHQLQCWVLEKDLPPSPALVSATKKDDYIASSCGVGPYHGQGDRWKGSITYHYTPCYPWDGLDRKKWPSTWWALFQMYYQHTWWKESKYIPDDHWKARLRGEYKPEPKYPSYGHGAYYGYGYDECEG